MRIRAPLVLTIAKALYVEKWVRATIGVRSAASLTARVAPITLLVCTAACRTAACSMSWRHLESEP
jgi:hypothetical protein